jgi:hypothetical protein
MYTEYNVTSYLNVHMTTGLEQHVICILIYHIIDIFYNESTFIPDTKLLHKVLDTLYPVHQCFKLKKKTLYNCSTHTL